MPTRQGTLDAAAFADQAILVTDYVRENRSFSMTCS